MITIKAVVPPARDAMLRLRHRASLSVAAQWSRNMSKASVVASPPAAEATQAPDDSSSGSPTGSGDGKVLGAFGFSRGTKGSGQSLMGSRHRALTPLGARIAPPFMEATDTSRLVCVVVVSYQEYSLTHSTRSSVWTRE